MKRGVWSAIGAYGIWGLFPIYWKFLTQVTALELISHRIIWSCVILIGIVTVLRQWKTFRRDVLNWSVLRVYAIASLLLTINWLVYVWGVTAGFIVETSLGYFINPLFSVLLGVVFLRERLRAWQWIPIGMATLGVLYLTIIYGSLPWIALTLAFSFGLYGFVKKTAPLTPIFGLTLETMIAFIPALGFLLFLEFSNQGAFLHKGAPADLLMIGAGIVTTIPLILFATAAKNIPLVLIGTLQYLTPTFQFLLGVLVYGEPFTPTQFVGFAIVWTALIIFAVESFLHHRAQPVAALE